MPDGEVADVTARAGIFLEIRSLPRFAPFPAAAPEPREEERCHNLTGDQPAHRLEMIRDIASQIPIAMKMPPDERAWAAGQIAEDVARADPHDALRGVTIRIRGEGNHPVGIK